MAKPSTFFLFFLPFFFPLFGLVGWSNHPQGPHEWFGHPRLAKPPPWPKWGVASHPQSYPFIFFRFFFKNIFNFALVFKFNFLIKYMTRGKGIIKIV
jgi:hypothetical protein